MTKLFSSLFAFLFTVSPALADVNNASEGLGCGGFFGGGYGGMMDGFSGMGYGGTGWLLSLVFWLVLVALSVFIAKLVWQSDFGTKSQKRGKK
jgi:uncharacterized membrane protein